MPISRVLSFIPRYKVSAIYLILLSPTGSSGLPLGIGRAILRAPIYMTLQPIRRTASLVAKRSGELLPHLFTLTHTEMRAVVFCHLNPKVTPSFPLRSVMLYVARTFLSIFPAEARKHERQTTILFYRHKDNTFFRITDQTAPLSNQRGHIHLASRPTKVTMFFAKVKHTPPQASNI